MRKRKSDALNFEVGELNLVPYMDIMVNLIIFMLFTMSGFVQMKVINVSLPAIDTGESSSEPPPEEPEKKLAIVLAILDKKGFIISLNGQIVNENLETVEKLPDGQYTINALSDGKYDLEKLKAVMEKVKAKDPTVEGLTIVPEKTVDYDSVIKVMDAIRFDAAGKKLYVDILLGVG